MRHEIGTLPRRLRIRASTKAQSVPMAGGVSRVLAREARSPRIAGAQACSVDALAADAAARADVWITGARCDLREEAI